MIFSGNPSASVHSELKLCQQLLVELDTTVEDVIYFGSHTRYWVRCGEYLICAKQQHRTFQLDETAPSWNDAVWLRWHANDGFLLEQYREEDEELLTLSEE